MNRMNPTLRYTQLGFAVAVLLDKEEPLTAEQAHNYVRAPVSTPDMDRPVS